MVKPPRPRFFRTAAHFRLWLERHHASAYELHVGFRKKSSGVPGMSYMEAIDEALCYGWIDGRLNSIDATSYMVRFTPRRPGGNWSRINVAKVKRLMAQGRMRPAGLKAFEARKRGSLQLYTYENRGGGLDPGAEKQLRRVPAAWRFWQGCTPSYRKGAAWWVASAKREETRARRLQVLIECCRRGANIPPLPTRQSLRRGRR